MAEKLGEKARDGGRSQLLRFLGWAPCHKNGEERLTKMVKRDPCNLPGGTRALQTRDERNSLAGTQRTGTKRQPLGKPGKARNFNAD